MRNIAIGFLCAVLFALIMLTFAEAEMFSAEDEFTWHEAEQNAEGLAGEVLYTNLTTPTAIASVKVETSVGHVVIERTSVLNPMPDLFKVVSWPEGYTVWPTSGRLEEGDTVKIAVRRFMGM